MHVHQNLAEEGTPIRSLISCGCPGYAVALAKKGSDELCKHCGAVLLCCLKADRRASLVDTLAKLPRPRSPAGRNQEVVREPNRSTRIKYRPLTRNLVALEDVQPREPGLVPAAGAVTRGKEPVKLPNIFQGYDQGAEEAAELLQNGGTLLSILSAKQTQKMAVYLMSKALRLIMMTAYTFDLLMISAALIEAAQQGVHVQVFVDQGHSMKGTTAEQMNRLEYLRSHGVEVFLSRGVSSGGIQHSKTLFVDGYFMAGSTNWTHSSRSNHEISTLLELSEEGSQAVMQKLQYMKEVSTLLTVEEVKTSQALREGRIRAKTAEPVDRFATARKFSVARARSREPRVI